MTDRDANRGGCAHSCRWNYEIIDNNKLINPESFSMSSKDLEAIHQIPYLIDHGVSSLKIEGRMKSIHYIATVVSTYRSLIDQYLKFGEIKDYQQFENEMTKAENRLSSIGFLEGTPGIEQQLYGMRSEQPSQLFIGLGLSYDEKTQIATIEQRNYFKLGDEIEVYNPSGFHYVFTLEFMTDENNECLEIARHPKQVLKIKVPNIVEPFAMIRKHIQIKV